MSGSLSTRGVELSSVARETTTSGCQLTRTRLGHQVSWQSTQRHSLYHLPVSCSLPNNKPLEIVYLDHHLVVVNKPAGLLVHRSPIDKHETQFALQMVRDQIGQRVYPTHRLDKPTSGVLLFALDPQTARAVSDQFAAAHVTKTYLAVVRGFAPQSGRIDHPLKEKHDAADPLKARQHKPAQTAVTEYRQLAQIEWPWSVDRYATARYSLLECRPRTGRRHQLRRHLKHIDHPIIGDTTYGKGPHNRLFRERLGIHRLLLHAMQLGLTHPITGAALDFRAATDDAFAILASAGLGSE